MVKQEVGGIVKRQPLLTATKDTKLWRVMTTHRLKVNKRRKKMNHSQKGCIEITIGLLDLCLNIMKTAN